MNRPAPLELDTSGGTASYVCLLKKNRKTYGLPFGYEGRARIADVPRAIPVAWDLQEAKYRETP